MIKIYDYMTNTCISNDQEDNTTLKKPPEVNQQDIDLIRQGHYKVRSKDLNKKDHRNLKRETYRLNIMKVI